ncbi:MAG TPA: T9SS type A sorting domain-containing protein [bacterium]|nr:T9SS type A sorting domain-containing protein [bacterium]
MFMKGNRMKTGNPSNAVRLIREPLLFLFLSLILTTHILAQNAAIDLNVTHQRIRGFGAANILPWRPDMTDSEIETAFGTEEGQLGFTILRLMIEPNRNNWNLNVRTARKAHDMGVLLFASPWNAPSDILETVDGLRRVRHDRYEDYAYHLDDFRIFMEDQGVPIYAISVQNEPDYGDWTRWTADEMLTFMRDYAPIIGTRVMAPESFQFRREMSDPILNDSLACANLDIVGGHIYGGGLRSYPLAESKEKEVWMTEHLSGENSHSNVWSWAIQVGTEINSVMHAGMNAYVWWYIVRYYGPISDGTNDSGRKGEVTKKGYVMSQFSRFIRPGYYRIECPRLLQRSVWGSAYKDSTSSRVVIVAINTVSEPKKQSFVFLNGHVEKFTPHVTSQTKDCSRENDIIVSNDSLHVMLDGNSITTFVSSGDVILSVERAATGPASYQLSQNHPNPFNASTRIQFETPERTFVSLKVYNILGHEVDELAGKEFSAGTHSVTFDASHLSSGIYFYAFKTKDYTQTQKMFLIR